MTAYLTAKELDALEALLAKATPGPWKSDCGSMWLMPQNYTIGEMDEEIDCDLAASLRNAAPRLLAAARREQKMREALKRCRDEMQESLENEGRLSSFSAAIAIADESLK